MRRLTMAAAAVVGAMGGGAVLGDDHMSGEHVDCSYVPWDCLDECLELKWCVAIPENDGIADCLSERLALAACEADPGGGPGGGSGGGGGVIIVPPCPGGQHYHAGGGCHGDHECGDDEIGGGDEECEACPDGEVPNPGGTACEIACGQIATDRVAKASLLSVPAEPMERGASVYCLKETVHIASWTPGNTCGVAYANRYAASCWSGGSKTDGCSLSRAHTHPFFAYPRDQDVLCRGHKIIGSHSDAIVYNLLGRDFSEGDRTNANSAEVMGHLGLPPFTPAEGEPTPEYRDTVKALRRSGVVEEI